MPRIIHSALLIIFITLSPSCHGNIGDTVDVNAGGDGPSNSGDGGLTGDAAGDAAQSNADTDTLGDSDVYIPPAGAPVLLFSDLVAGANSGWSAADPNQGVAVTVWGHNLGNIRGTSYISVGAINLSGDGDYPEAWGQRGKPIPYLASITFFLNDSMTQGTQNISVTVDGVKSNSLPFNINSEAIYFIDNANSGAGLGTLLDPWSDPKSFVDAMAPGDVGYFRGGTYSEKYNGGKQNIWVRSTEAGGTVLNPIGFVGYPGEVVIMDGVTNGDANFHTSLQFESGAITVSRMNILGIKTAVSGGDDIRIVGNDMVGGTVFFSGAGIIQIGGSRGRVYGNSVHGGTTANRLDHAIYISGCDPGGGNHLGWNYIHDNDFDRGPMVVINHQESRCPSTEYVRSHKIFSNFVDCTGSPSRGIGVYDLSWDGGSETEPEAPIIFNNIVLGCGGTGQPAMYQNAAHTEFINNTILGSEGDGIQIDGSRVISSKVVNNILDLATSGGSYFTGSGGQRTVSNNLYFGAGAADGADTAPIEGDAKFTIDKTNWLFLLAADGAAIDGGLSSEATGIVHDFNNNVRVVGSSVDVGAVEFVE